MSGWGQQGITLGCLSLSKAQVTWQEGPWEDHQRGTGQGGQAGSPRAALVPRLLLVRSSPSGPRLSRPTAASASAHWPTLPAAPLQSLPSLPSHPSSRTLKQGMARASVDRIRVPALPTMAGNGC